MVERINKPETTPAYRILPAKEAKDDESKRQEYEEGDEHYQKGGGGGDWGKYRGRSMTIKPVRVPRERIDKVLFKNTFMRSGMGILETTVVWKDGRTTDSALFLIPRTDDYMKLRIMKRGQVVPEIYWAKGEQIEMGIVQLEPSSGSWGVRELERESRQKKTVSPGTTWLSSFGLVDKATGRFQWFGLLIYLLGAAVLTLAIVFAVR